MSIGYDELKKTAARVRAELAGKGVMEPGKLRRKPRSKDKSDAIYAAAMNRADKFKPYREGGALILPYFR